MYFIFNYGFLLAHIRKTRISPWNENGDLSFILPEDYYFDLEEFVEHIFQPLINQIYPKNKIICVVDNLSLFKCQLFNKPGYVKAFGQYIIKNKKLWDKLSIFTLTDATKETLTKIKNIYHRDNQGDHKYYWSTHTIEREHLRRHHYLIFPTKNVHTLRYYRKKYKIKIIPFPKNWKKILKLFYGNNYMFPPIYFSLKYNICQHQKQKIRQWCFGGKQKSKYQGIKGKTLNVTKVEVAQCSAFKVFSKFNVIYTHTTIGRIS